VSADTRVKFESQIHSPQLSFELTINLLSAVPYLLIQMKYIFFVFGATAPQWASASSLTRFLDPIQRRITVSRTPLDEWSSRHRDLYLTTHNTHNRQTSMLPVGFELTVSAGERLQTYVFDRAATGDGKWSILLSLNCNKLLGVWVYCKSDDITVQYTGYCAILQYTVVLHSHKHYNNNNKRKQRISIWQRALPLCRHNAQNTLVQDDKSAYWRRF